MDSWWLVGNWKVQSWVTFAFCSSGTQVRLKGIEFHSSSPSDCHSFSLCNLKREVH